MKKILAAIDFSECSINALEHALVIADKADADVRMVWVETPELGREQETYSSSKKSSEIAKEKLDRLINKYQVGLSKGVLDYKIRKGKIYKEIVQEAEDINAWLVIVGTHGVSGMEEYFLGSNANKIVTASTHPIITIRLSDKSIERYLKKIVLPFDDSLETRQKVPFAVELAKVFNSEIHVLKVYTSNLESNKERTTQYVKQVEAYLESEGINFTIVSLKSDHIAKVTLKYAEEIDANLIVSMTEQTSGTMGFLLGTMASRLVHHSKFPVMSIHPQEFIKTLSR
ncbi:MAG: universal stress protein [Bacteroidales bacterium]